MKTTILWDTPGLFTVLRDLPGNTVRDKMASPKLPKGKLSGKNSGCDTVKGSKQTSFVTLPFWASASSDVKQAKLHQLHKGDLG